MKVVFAHIFLLLLGVLQFTNHSLAIKDGMSCPMELQEERDLCCNILTEDQDDSSCCCDSELSDCEKEDFLFNKFLLINLNSKSLQKIATKEYPAGNLLGFKCYFSLFPTFKGKAPPNTHYFSYLRPLAKVFISYRQLRL